MNCSRFSPNSTVLFFAGPPPTQQEKEDPEYKACMQELSDLRHDTEVLLRRVRIDNHKNLEHSLNRVMDIMNGQA